MKRVLSVRRLFPLGKFKNIAYEDNIELESVEEFMDLVEKFGSEEGIYAELTKQIYRTFLDHEELIEILEQLETREEKRKVLNDVI